jgi:hypothetical protein
MENYVQALKEHDWYYGYSDDPQAYRKGQNSHSALRKMAKTLDPDLKIWKKHSPF